MARPGQVQAVEPRTLGDQALYVAAFVVGVTGTLLVKHTGQSTAVTAVVPVLVILLYGLIAQFTTRLRLEPDMIGDNCYYLGFMLTLVSLAWTLYRVAESPEDADLVREIISGFGVALASTITGIFMRALFLQLRPDSVSSERRARLSVLQAVRELRGELSVSVRELRDFGRQTEQTLGEQLKAIDEASREALDAHRQWMKRYAADTAQEIASTHRDSIRAVVETIEKTTREAGELVNEHVAQTGASLAEATRLLDERIARIAAGSAAFDRIATQAAERIGGCTGGLSESVERVADVLDHTADTLGTRTETYATAVRTAAERLDQVTTEAGQQLQSLTGDLIGTLASLSEATTTLTETATAAAELGQLLAEARERADRLQALPTPPEGDRLARSMADVLDSMTAFTAGAEHLGSLAAEMTERARAYEARAASPLRRLLRSGRRALAAIGRKTRRLLARRQG